MISWKSKAGSFLLGISIGIFLGAGFFLIKVNDLFSSLKENLLKHQFSLIERESDADSVHKSGVGKNIKKNPFKISLRSVPVKYKEVDSLIVRQEPDDSLNIQTEIKEGEKNIRVVCLPPDSSQAHSTMELLVEFKRNPLNSKGYIFSGNVLTLYGVHASVFPEVYCIRNKFYILFQDELYEIYPSGPEIQPFRKVSAELIRKYLN